MCICSPLFSVAGFRAVLIPNHIDCHRSYKKMVLLVVSLYRVNLDCFNELVLMTACIIQQQILKYMFAYSLSPGERIKY